MVGEVLVLLDAWLVVWSQHADIRDSSLHSRYSLTPNPDVLARGNLVVLNWFEELQGEMRTRSRNLVCRLCAN